jgi:hypothetical protein
MRASQLTHGQFFNLAHQTDVLECVAKNRPADWNAYPGTVYRNTRTGLYGGLGGGNEVVLCSRPAHAPTSKLKSAGGSMDISSGLGIGGAGSDDYNMATEGERYSPQFSSRKSSGQLWEPCARRGCDNEPSCLDCGYCLDKHCQCGKGGN